MKLEDCGKTTEEMTDEELLARLRAIRRRRMIEKPAAKRIVEKAQKKESKVRTSRVSGLLGKMSQDERDVLIKQLQEGE